MNSRAGATGAFDVAVVGAGIVGLSCARAAALQGLRVVVVDRDAQANGASVRNFGFVTLTGQERGPAWMRARRTCAVWRQVAAEAGIEVVQRGMWLVAQRPEAVPVLEAFLKTEMGEGCELLSRAAAGRRCPDLANGIRHAVLVSRDDIRVESRDAIPKIAAWLSSRFGVKFLRETMVTSIDDGDPPSLRTSHGRIHAGAVIVCPGDDLASLYAERIAGHGVTRCKLQMMRLADPGFKLPGALMSDLSLLRYGGFAALPEAAPLRTRLEVEQAELLAHGIHLIVVQGVDGSLIVGDSHHYAPTPDPFADEHIDRLILEEFSRVSGRPASPVLERWIGTYSYARNRMMFVDAPAARVRLVMVTSGSGASTGFAIGEDLIKDLFGGSTFDVDT